jgi:hypothetical protein
MDDKVSLKEYFERILSEKDKALDAALNSAKEAVTVAEKNSEKWRENANEWRGAMTDREKSFISRTEFDQYKNSIERQLVIEKENMDINKGKIQGVKDFRDWIPWIITIGMTLLYIYNLKH